MLLLFISVATAALLLTSVYLFNKAEQEQTLDQISIDDLHDLPLSGPPVIVRQMKDGKVQQTLCYLSAYGLAPEAAVVEVDTRDRLLSRLQPDGTIAL